MINGMAFFGVVYVLYTSIRQDWRVIPAEWKNWKPLNQGTALMIQAVAHWTGIHEGIYGVILSFDFEDERFELNYMPLVNKKPCRGTMKFLWQGNLAVLCQDQHYLSRYNMYMRKEGSWVTMFSFDLSGGVRDVFWVLKEEEDGVRALVKRKTNSELFLYETTAGFIPLMDEFSNALVFPQAYDANDFVESLLFP